MSNNMPQMPLRPKARTAGEFGAAYRKYPFLLVENTPISDYDFANKTDRNRYYADNGVYALGRIRGKHLIDFEDVFKMSIDKAVMLWFVVVGYENARQNNADTTTLINTGVLHEPDNNLYFTPIGEMKGSPESNALEMTAFFFSCFGRIVREKEDGEFELEQTSMEELIELLDYDMISSALEDDSENEEDASFFLRVLNIVKAFDRKKVEAEQELKEDDLKNSADASVKDSKPKRTSKIANAKKP